MEQKDIEAVIASMGMMIYHLVSGHADECEDCGRATAWLTEAFGIHPTSDEPNET